MTSSSLINHPFHWWYVHNPAQCWVCTDSCTCCQWLWFDFGSCVAEVQRPGKQIGHAGSSPSILSNISINICRCGVRFHWPAFNLERKHSMQRKLKMEVKLHRCMVFIGGLFLVPDLILKVKVPSRCSGSSVLRQRSGVNGIIRVYRSG